MMAAVCLNDMVVAEARKWIGTPYKHQHSTMDHGCDCLGLVRGIWRNVVGSEPRPVPSYSSRWDEVDKTEILLNTVKDLFDETDVPQTGDVLVFRTRRGVVAKHCAIMTEHNRMVHSYNNIGVMECYIVPWWKSRLVYSGQFPRSI